MCGGQSFKIDNHFMDLVDDDPVVGTAVDLVVANHDGKGMAVMIPL